MWNTRVAVGVRDQKPMKSNNARSKPMVTKVVMTGLCLSFMAARGLAQTLIFPHLVDGNIGDTTRWSTEIDLVNTTTLEQTAKVSFFNPNGTAKVIVFPKS